MSKVNEALALLGLKVKDSVTELEGVVTSISFELYGCIQAIVNPGLDKDGKERDMHWFDISRLTVISAKPVQDQPDFEYLATILGPEHNKPIPQGH